MTPYQPWRRVPEGELQPYEKLASYFCPAIRLKPFDLWQNPRVYFRAAILKQPQRGRYIARIQLAIHYVWDIPSQQDLGRLKPGWAVQTVKRIHDRFLKHEEDWGPGDVELVKVILQRKPTLPDLDLLAPSEFVVDEMTYRVDAHPSGVFKQILDWDWDKLGNKRLYFTLRKTKFEMKGKRPILTNDSYHHSFFRPHEVGDKAQKWPQVVIPKIEYFDKDSWKHFQISKKKRGYESWETGGG
ncbi:MAG: hypothetical protein GTO29_13300 [Candidatus Latescibacteria bacterium]|nr:hypothetical protein [Candidatus Latescibacterota bacterium]NIO57227.1 hypothetical protein [Candidatus Latescibacterota bacterium]